MPETPSPASKERAVPDRRWDWPGRSTRGRSQRKPAAPRFEPLEERALLAVAPLGDAFTVNTFTAGDQTSAFLLSPLLPRTNNQSVAMDAAGNFLVVWQSHGQDGDGWGIYGQRFDVGGQKLGDEFRVNTTTVGNQRDPLVAMNAGGSIVVAWTDESRVIHTPDYFGSVAQRFSAEGEPIGEELLAIEYPASKIGMDDAGNFFVGAIAHPYPGEMSVPHFASRRFSYEGLLLGESRVRSDFGWVQNVFADMVGDGSSVVVDEQFEPYIVNGRPAGNSRILEVLHVDSAGAETARRDILRYSFCDFSCQSEGANFGDYLTDVGRLGHAVMTVDNGLTPEQLSSAGAALQGLVLSLPGTKGLAVDDQGNAFAVRWDPAAQEATLSLYDSQGLPTAENSLITAANEYTWFGVATSNGNTAVVIWTAPGLDGNGYGVRARLFRVTSDSVPQIPNGPELLVNSTASGDQQLASVSRRAVGRDAAGNFVVAWAAQQPQSDGWDVYARRFDAAGVPQGDEFPVNTSTAGNQFLAGVALDPEGDFVVSWSGAAPGASYGVYARRYNKAGQAQGDEFSVSAPTAGDQRYSQVALAPDGSFAITWSWLVPGLQNVVALRRFAADGAPLGDVQLVDPQFGPVASNVNQLYPALALDSSGELLVTYAESQGDASGFDVVARRFDDQGAPLGSEFLVNTTTAGDQLNSTVAVSNWGDVTIAWSSRDQDASGWGVVAQQLSANGQRLGEERRLNTTTVDDQTAASLAVSGNGDLVAVWTSAGQDGEAGGVYAQRFTAAVAELLGDANGDNKVDLADFGLLKQHFGAAGNRATGDFDGDGVIGLGDFGLLKGNFGQAGKRSEGSAQDMLLGLAFAEMAEELHDDAWFLPQDACGHLGV